jgi:hypothetical protein
LGVFFIENTEGLVLLKTFEGSDEEIDNFGFLGLACGNYGARVLILMD